MAGLIRNVSEPSPTASGPSPVEPIAGGTCQQSRPVGSGEAPLEVYDYEGHPVRIIIGADGEPWWVAGDVGRVLGHRMASDATRLLEDDEKGTQIVRTPGGPQPMAVVNEPGLYTLIMSSRKTEARRFRKWVTHEVLPSIRRTGCYATPAAEITPAGGDLLLDTARTLVLTIERQITAERRLDAAEAEIRSARALAEAAESKASAALATLSDGTGYMALVGWSALNQLGLTRQELSAWGKRLTRHCREAGIAVKQAPSEIWGKVNVYPIAILESHLGVDPAAHRASPSRRIGATSGPGDTPAPDISI